MTKASATKRDNHLVRIVNFVTEIIKEVKSYQEDFNNDGFIHSIDEYATSLSNSAMTSRGILQAIIRGAETPEATSNEEQGQPEPIRPHAEMGQWFVPAEGAAPRVRVGAERIDANFEEEMRQALGRPLGGHR